MPSRENARRKGCDLLDEMLAGIEDQKDPLVAQPGHQVRPRIGRADRQPQHGGDGRGHQLGIAQHSEVDEERGSPEGLAETMGHRHRDRGLADTAGADDGHEVRGGQLGRQCGDVLVAADHPAEAVGKIGVREMDRRGGCCSHWKRSSATPARRSNSRGRRGW